MARLDTGVSLTKSKLTHILRGNPEFMEQLSLCLDRDVRFIPNWKHLASKLEVEVDVIKRLEQYGDFSPTFRLFYFLETSKPDLTIKELKETMLEIGRNDLLSLLTTEGDCTDSEKVIDVITKPSKAPSPRAGILDELALALDGRSLVLSNWYTLAIKLGVQRITCWTLERRSAENPTGRLFQYLATSCPKLTLRSLKEALDSIERRDLMDVLKNKNLEDDALLKDVITPGSELLERISQELNRDDNIGVKNYIHLASKLEVPADVRREFADINECRKSPTKEVLEWVAARFPETTLSDVAKALEEIQRKDAIQIISRHFPDIIGSPSSPGGQPRNLPCLTAHFVGRDVDVNEIVKKLQTFRMVVLLSIPGMGKTEVGIRVSHLLKQRGDQFVTHIRVESHHRKLVDICREILDRLSSRTWSQTADVISLAKRKLSEQNIPTVIVLDNSENIQGEEFDKFTKWLVKSASNVKLIITTQKDVGFLSADVCKFPLKPLDPVSSAELLQDLVGNCSEEHSKELAKLCGGIPLLLVTCSDLLNNGFSRELLIQQLGNNPIQFFRISANDVYNTLEVFFNNFSNEVKQNLVLFSVFPSEFSAQDIQFLFEDPLHCQTEKTRMVKYALLQREAEGKMRMHLLIQAYLRTENESLGMGDLWRTTQRKFNHHYLSQLRFLSKVFISKDSALVAISEFRQQKANIMEALKNCLKESSDLDDKHFVLDVVNSTEVLGFVAKVLTPPKECRALYQKCCDIAKAYGDKKRHAESLNSLGFRRLCDVSHSKDSPEENPAILAKFQEAYEMCKTLPEEGKKSQTYANTVSKLGVCFVLQEEEKKGRELIQEGILIRESLNNRLYVAHGYCDLGNSYRLCGDHQKAIDIWKENTLPVYNDQLGDHPWTASILSHIAVSYKALAAGNPERDYISQAEKYFREAQGLRERLLGHHQDTARSCVQLSDVLVLQGQFDKALGELNKALVIQNDLLGPDHKITKNTVSKMSDLMDKGDQILVNCVFSKPKLEVKLLGLGEQTEAFIQNLCQLVSKASFCLLLSSQM